MTVINHPIGTYHTMPRKWLNENGQIFPKKDAPDETRIAWANLTQLGPVSKKQYNAFWKEHAKYMRYVTRYGCYDYRSTLKIFDE